METPEQCLKSAESSQQRHHNNIIDVVLVSLLLTLRIFHTFSNVSIADFE